MAGAESPRLALLVRSAPHRHRETRAEPDLALASAALDYRLEVYFLGHAVMQLASGKANSEALLPAGYRAWAAVPELSDARFFAEAGCLGRLEGQGVEWVLPVEKLDTESMRLRWRNCDHVMVL